MSLTEAQARKKIMDYIAIRDHSELELRQKLESQCEPEIIEQALVWAQKQMWMAKPQQLQEKVVDQLNRRGKGVIAINEVLKDKGLPEVKLSVDTEYKKAAQIITAKWSHLDFQDIDLNESQKLKSKIIRFLIARGFESEVAQQILKDELKVGVLSHDEQY